MSEKLVPSAKIYLAKSEIANAGRGVFAVAEIVDGEVIETCPVVVLLANDYEHLKATELRNYYFMWEEAQAAIFLGYGSLYNHSYEPNATYTKNIGEGTIIFTAIKGIGEGEEITVNYNFGNPDDKSKLWIEDVPPPENSD